MAVTPRQSLSAYPLGCTPLLRVAVAGPTNVAGLLWAMTSAEERLPLVPLRAGPFQYKLTTPVRTIAVVMTS